MPHGLAVAVARVPQHLTLELLGLAEMVARVLFRTSLGARRHTLVVVVQAAATTATHTPVRAWTVAATADHNPLLIGKTRTPEHQTPVVGVGVRVLGTALPQLGKEAAMVARVF
jgi:hypothetical protein